MRRWPYAGLGRVPGHAGALADTGQLPGGPVPAVQKVFDMISTATVTKSAADARAKLFLRPGDGVTINRDRLLADAKAKALAMVEGYTPTAPIALSLPGAAGAVPLAARSPGWSHARWRHRT